MRPPPELLYFVLFCCGHASPLTNSHVTSPRVDVETASSKRRRLGTNVTEEIHLILTPQAFELTDVAKKAFSRLFEEAMTNFVGLSQSLSSHESNELEVESITCSISNQLIDSVFVLGAADASTKIFSHETSRSLLRRKSEPMRSLLSGASSGVIISNLDLKLSMLVTLAAEEPDVEKNHPVLKDYTLDFFSPGSHTSDSFIEAARHITDEFGVAPLSQLQYIGIGKSELWDNPFSFLDGNTPSFVAEVRDQGVESSSDQGDTATTQWWMIYVLVGSCVALAALLGLLVSLVVGGRKKKRKNLKRKAAEVPEVPQLLKCNVSLPTSPVSFEGGENTALQQKLRRLQQEEEQQHQQHLKQQQQLQQEEQQQHQQHLEHQQQLQQQLQQQQMGRGQGPQPQNPGFSKSASKPVKIATSLDKRDTPRELKEKKKSTDERNWKDSLSIFAGFGLKKLDSRADDNPSNSDEDSRGNEVPTLMLPPKKERKHTLATQTDGRNTRGGQRSVVDDLLGGAAPQSTRHQNHISSDDLYVIPEDDASM